MVGIDCSKSKIGNVCRYQGDQGRVIEMDVLSLLFNNFGPVKMDFGSGMAKENRKRGNANVAHKS